MNRNQKLSGMILSYVINCDPRYRRFKSTASLERFVGRLMIDRAHDKEGTYVDSIIVGELEVVDSAITVEFDNTPADEERSRAVLLIMDLVGALRTIGGKPTLKDLVKLAKRIKND